MDFYGCSAYASIGVGLIPDSNLELIWYTVRCAGLIRSRCIQGIINLQNIFVVYSADRLGSLSPLKYIVTALVGFCGCGVGDGRSKLDIVLTYGFTKLAVEVILHLVAEITALGKVCGIGIRLKYIALSIFHRRIMAVLFAAGHRIPIGVGPVGKYIAVGRFRLGTLGGSRSGGHGLRVKGHSTLCRIF